MERIGQAGFGPQGEFSIPWPLAYVPSLHLLLQERVEGPRAKRDLHERRGAELPGRGRAARALVGPLPRHGAQSRTHFETLRVLSSDEISEKKQRWLRMLAESGGRVADSRHGWWRV